MFHQQGSAGWINSWMGKIQDLTTGLSQCIHNTNKVSTERRRRTERWGHRYPRYTIFYCCMCKWVVCFAAVETGQRTHKSSVRLERVRYSLPLEAIAFSTTCLSSFLLNRCRRPCVLVPLTWFHFLSISLGLVSVNASSSSLFGYNLFHSGRTNLFHIRMKIVSFRRINILFICKYIMK